MGEVAERISEQSLVAFAFEISENADIKSETRSQKEHP